MWSLTGSQAVDQPICCFGPESLSAVWYAALGLTCVAGLSATLGMSRGGQRSATLGLSVGQLASVPSAHPPEVSGVGSQSANLGARIRASGERWGCLSRVHSPGAEWGGAPEAIAAAESSLTSP